MSAAPRHTKPATGFLLLALVVSLAGPGCAPLEDFQKRWQSAAAKRALTGKEKKMREAHTAFRSQPGWRKLTYRDDALLAKATAANSAVEISLREQRGLLVVDGGIAMDFPVATGKSSHPTPKGDYKILDKKQDYASNLYGRIVSETGETVVSDADSRSDAVPPGGRFVGARMPYWMRMSTTGVGMHVGYVPGRPASHGCIRLRKETAAELFRILAVGSPVKVDSFSATLGGPVGLESVVIGEVAARPASSRPRPKPAATPSATPAAPAAETVPTPADAAPAATPAPAPEPAATPSEAPAAG